MPYEYLKQYIGYIEKSYCKKAVRLTFRDPAKGTENFALSLYDEKDVCFYSCASLKIYINLRIIVWWPIGKTVTIVVMPTAIGCLI